MAAKYIVEYSAGTQEKSSVHRYETEDLTSFYVFLSELLERNLIILALYQDGVEVASMVFDQMIRTAANLLASRHICASLLIRAEEEQHRFGFSK